MCASKVVIGKEYMFSTHNSFAAHSFAGFLSFHFHWHLPHGRRQINSMEDFSRGVDHKSNSQWLRCFQYGWLLFLHAFIWNHSVPKRSITVFCVERFWGTDVHMVHAPSSCHMNDLLCIIILPWTDLFMHNLSLSISNPQINTVRNGKTYWWNSVDRSPEPPVTLVELSLQDYRSILKTNDHPECLVGLMRFRCFVSKWSARMGWGIATVTITSIDD